MMLLSQSGRPPAEEEFHESREAEAAPGLELSVHQVMLIVRAHWKKILIIALSIMIVGGTGIKLLPKSYTSTATLKVDADLKDPLAGEAGPEERGGYIPTEIQLMRSDDVLLAVVDHLGLTRNKEFAAGYSGDPANLREWVKEKLYKDLEIQQGVEGSLLINVSATSRDSLMAAKLANAVADAYVDQERRRLDDPAAERARRYGEQLAELKSKVSVAEDQLAAFRQRTGITDPTGQKTADLEALAAMEKRLEEAKNARREAEVQAAAQQQRRGGDHGSLHPSAAGAGGAGDPTIAAGAAAHHAGRAAPEGIGTAVADPGNPAGNCRTAAHLRAHRQRRPALRNRSATEDGAGGRPAARQCAGCRCSARRG
jgi:uncharacterized protein involved in exopolysaccharide biosynthesis